MSSSKVISASDAAKLFKSGMTFLCGGFVGCGAAHEVIDELIKRDDLKDMTLVCNDGGFGHTEEYPDGYGSGKMIIKKQFKHIIASHIGINKEIKNQMDEGTLTVELVPQGSLAERLRAAGFGLGGVITPTGIGSTLVENGTILPTNEEHKKQKLNINGKEYLLELPIPGDIAACSAKRADKFGNVQFHGTTRNFGDLMLYAAPITIVEVEELVDCLDPDLVHVPGVVVKHIVVKQKKK